MLHLKINISPSCPLSVSHFNLLFSFDFVYNFLSMGKGKKNSKF